MSRDAPWQMLFTAAVDPNSAARVPMRLLRRRGQPFLLLPLEGRLAAQALSLYPGQTSAARAAKVLLRAALRVGWSAALEKITVVRAHNDPFALYLERAAGRASTPFAMLAGNPNTGAQRLIFLLFDRGGKPAAVVKAGSNEAAGELIQQEQTFLQSVPAGIRGVPALRSTFASGNVRAFATDFFPGDSPRDTSSAHLEQLFTSWLHSGRTMTIGESPLWQRLLAAAQPQLPPPVKSLATATICPAIFHGDFAPWNIKVSGGVWMPIDWERGQLAGLPLWDWLHFIVQPAVLVKHAPPESVLDQVEDLFASPAFQRYAVAAKISRLERPLAFAYLHHCIHVLRQTEGLQAIQTLPNLCLQRWRPHLTN